MSITIAGLRKTYGKNVAVDGIDFEVPPGSVFGLLGPNGAGKTSTFKCMLGLARPTAGTVLYNGAPLSPALFERLAYVPERSALYEWMTVADHFEMQRRSFQRFNPKRAAELLELFDIDTRKRVRALSKGMRTAVSVALAFGNEPEIMVLDEPTSGLDPVNQREVLKLIIDAAANGTTIVLSSHQIGQVERAADHIAVLKRGRCVLTGAVDDLKSDSKIVEAIFASEQSAASAARAAGPQVRVERTGRILRLTVTRAADELAARLSAEGAQSVRVVDLNLEDIFLNAVDPRIDTADLVETVR